VRISPQVNYKFFFYAVKRNNIKWPNGGRSGPSVSCTNGKEEKKEATSYLSWLFTSIFPSFSVPEHTLIDYVPFLATIFLTLTLTHIAYIDKFLHKTLPANDFHGWNDIKISPLICVFNLNIGKIAASNEFIAYRDTERVKKKFLNETLCKLFRSRQEWGGGRRGKLKLLKLPITWLESSHTLHCSAPLCFLTLFNRGRYQINLWIGNDRPKKKVK
jgi:hypothetical protein